MAIGSLDPAQDARNRAGYSGNFSLGSIPGATVGTGLKDWRTSIPDKYLVEGGLSAIRAPRPASTYRSPFALGAVAPSSFGSTEHLGGGGPRQMPGTPLNMTGPAGRQVPIMSDPASQGRPGHAQGPFGPLHTPSLPGVTFRSQAPGDGGFTHGSPALNPGTGYGNTANWGAFLRALGM